MTLRIVLIAVLLSLTNAFIFPDGYEALYEYRAKVIANMIGEENTSKYEIFADVFFHKHDTIVEMRLENVKYSAYTGVATKNGNIVPPSEGIMKRIQLPFFFVMENDSYTMKVHKSDEQWSVDMKKSIAHMFYINESVLKLSLNKVHYEAEVIIGDSRKCSVEYKVYKELNEYSVWKDFGSLHCFMPNMELNFIPKRECNIPEDFNNAIKYYSIKNESNGLVVDNIFSEGIYNSLYNKFSVIVEQHVGIKSIDKKTIGKGIDSDYVEVTSIQKRKIDMEDNMNKARRTLLLMVDYVLTMDIKLTEALNKQKEGFASLLDHIKELDEEHLLKLFSEISQMSYGQSMKELFVQMLPFVNTKESNRAIRHFILNKLVEDNMAVFMLQNMYAMKIQLENPYVKEFEDLTKEDSGLSENVRNAAILAFGTTIGNTEASLFIGASIKEFDESVNSLASKMVEAKTYKDQLILINAIGNIQYTKVVPTLDKIIKGRKPFDNLTPHLRALAMLSNLQSIRGISDRSNVVQIQDKCMYHFKDKMEGLELRLAALQVLMEMGKERMWIELYWHMLKEQDDEIVNFYYSFLKSRAESENGCNKYHVGFAKQLLKMQTKFPAKNKSSFAEIYEFVDSLHKMGSGINVLAYGDLNKDKFHTIYIENIFNYMDAIFSVNSLYVHFKLNKNFDGILEVTLENFMELQDVVTVELISYKNNIATNVAIFKPEHVKQTLKSWWEDVSKENMFVISRHNYLNVESFADYGFPVRTYMSSSSLRYSDNIELIAQNGTLLESIDIKSKQFDDLEYGCMVKNPLLDVWHGIRRVQRVNTVIDFQFKLETENSFGKFNLSWDSNDRRASGFETFGHTEVFIKGSQKVLQISCGDCKKYLNTGSPNVNNYTLWEYDDKLTGSLYRLKIFNCDSKGIKQYKSHLKEILAENPGKLNLKSIFSIVNNYWYYMTLMMPEKTCSIGFSMQPSKTHVASKAFFVSEITSENRKWFIENMNKELYLERWRTLDNTNETKTLKMYSYNPITKNETELSVSINHSTSISSDSFSVKVFREPITKGGDETKAIFNMDLKFEPEEGDLSEFYENCDWNNPNLDYPC